MERISDYKVASSEQLFKNGDRVQYQQRHGRFAGYVKSGEVAILISECRIYLLK